MTSDLDSPPAATPAVNVWARRSLRWGVTALGLILASMVGAPLTANFGEDVLKKVGVPLVSSYSTSILDVAMFLAILAFLTGTVTGAAAFYAAVVGGIQILFWRKDEHGLMRILVGGPAGLLAGVAIPLALILPRFFVNPGPAHESSCGNNLKQIGLVCRMVAEEDPEGYFPPLSVEPGRLMFSSEAACGQVGVYPEYLPETVICTCPSNGKLFGEIESQLKTNPGIGLNDQSYFYLGYVVSNDDQVKAFAEVYRQQVKRGESFCDNLPAPPGRGSFGGDAFLRLQIKVERKGAPGSDDPEVLAKIMAGIPVMVERPIRHGRNRAASNVLYLDGHVESIKYPGKWPVTEATINTLLELDRLGGQ